MNKAIPALLFGVLGLIAAGCGGSGGSSSSCKGATVEYSVDCEAGPTCINTSSIKQDTSGKSQYMTCVWQCASYGDKIEAHVTVNFSKTGSGCWQEDSVEVVGGKTIAEPTESSSN